jgi:hypothetical protein
MKKIALAISLVFSNSVLASDEIFSAPKLMEGREVLLECAVKNRINQSNLNGDYYQNSMFLLSDNYCINRIDTKQEISTSLMVKRSEMNALYSRYYDAYTSLKTFEDKIAFVDLFLQKSSRQYYITPSFGRNNENIKINFYREGNNGKPVGHALKLFPDTPFDKSSADLYERLTKSSKTSSDDKLIFIVNEVLANSKKKLTSLSDVYLDDCDFDCQDREHDDDYENWAEDQADNWCNSCDSFWEDDYDAGERYLIIFNDDGDLWDAYHYSPWDDEWWS